MEGTSKEHPHVKKEYCTLYVLHQQNRKLHFAMINAKVSKQVIFLTIMLGKVEQYKYTGPTNKNTICIQVDNSSKLAD